MRGAQPCAYEVASQIIGQILMQYRTLGKTAYEVSRISFGAWAIGGAWGDVDDQTSLDALHRALDLGVNFIDTADVYGDGRSEKLLGRLAKDRPGEFKVATKVGRRAMPAHTAESYTAESVARYVERCLENLQTDSLDLVQLHCPPTQVFYRPEIFDAMETLHRAGKVRQWGASVEKIEEGLKAMQYPVISAIQIVFNIFRQRPAELFLEQARKRGVGVIARLPLASGLLTGKLTREKLAALPEDDHRKFNQLGEIFDSGETLSGLGGNLDQAWKAVDELRRIAPAGWSMIDLALRWILMFDGISCAIPGAKRRDQVEQNTRAADLPPLSDQHMMAIAGIYDRYVRDLAHQRW